jgi:hypothetical protein
VRAPPLTAATEGASAAVLALVRAWLEMEPDGSAGDGDAADVRRLPLRAVGQAAGRDGPPPESSEPDFMLTC